MNCIGCRRTVKCIEQGREAPFRRILKVLLRYYRFLPGGKASCPLVPKLSHVPQMSQTPLTGALGISLCKILEPLRARPPALGRPSVCFTARGHFSRLRVRPRDGEKDLAGDTARGQSQKVGKSDYFFLSRGGFIFTLGENIPMAVFEQNTSDRS